MTHISLEPIVVSYQEHCVDTIVQRSGLFGLLRWEEVVHTDRLKHEVIVYTDLPVKILPLKQKS